MSPLFSYLSETVRTKSDNLTYDQAINGLLREIQFNLKDLMISLWKGSDYISVEDSTAHESMYVDLFGHDVDIETQAMEGVEPLYNLRISTHPRKYRPRNGGLPIDMDVSIFVVTDEDEDEYNDPQDESIWRFNYDGFVAYLTDIVNKLPKV
jgi:hypothetical protein